MINPECVTINPEAPDNWWVSPSGSDCWCRVGELKQLLRLRGIIQNDILSALDDCAELEMTAAEVREVLKMIVAKALHG